MVFFDTLISHSRFKTLVLDDSAIARNRGKAVELLTFVFDHAIGIFKNNRQMHHFNGELYNLDNLAVYFARMNTDGDILGSVLVRTNVTAITGANTSSSFPWIVLYLMQRPSADMGTGGR